jgi:hypothetical protein
MWFEKRGIVVKISARHCIVITPNGTYVKIPLPAQGAQVGAELAFQRLPFHSKWKPLLMVASFLIVFMSYALLHQADLPQAAAYISLDINPSLEIAVDKNLKVIDVQCFNDDASNLIQPEELQGKNMYDAFTEVINKAIEQNYIKPGEDNLIISTVSPSGTEPVLVDQEAVGQFLQNTVTARGYTGQVTVYSASDEIRATAKNEGLSPGKYLIYQQLIKSGNQVSIDEVKKNAVRQLISKYNVELIPNYKKFTIQKSSGVEAEINVDDNGNSVSIKDYLKNKNTWSDSAKNQAQPSNNINDNSSKTNTNKDDESKQNDNPVRPDSKKQDKPQIEINKNDKPGINRGSDAKVDWKSSWLRSKTWMESQLQGTNIRLKP